MQRPLLEVAIAYAAGLLLAWAWPLPLPLLFVGGLATVVAAFAGIRRWAWLLWPLFMMAGWINLTRQQAVLSPVDLRRVVGTNVWLAEIEGRLATSPEERVSVRDAEESWRTLAVVDVNAVRERSQDWQPAVGRVAVKTGGLVDPGFSRGRRVRIFGMLRTPRQAAAPGLFDHRAHLRWKGIHYELEARQPEDWTSAEPGGAPAHPAWSDRFVDWARRTLSRGLPAEDEALRLLWAMNLGWRAALTDEVSEPFMRTGTMHIFAISGLHIALMSGIVVAVLRVLRVPRGWCGAVVVPWIWFYTAATGWQASAIRSTIMMTVVIVGWSLRRPSDLLNSLTASALIILVWDPGQLFQASFQLSFFVVLSIALLLPPLERRFERWWRPDPWLPEAAIPRWRKALEGPLRWLTTSGGTSLAAWLGSLPLVAHYFHLVTPISLVANLVIVPLSGLALMSSLGSLACGAWWPGLSELFNHSGWFWMWCMVRLSRLAADIPGAAGYVPGPGPLFFILYYATLAGVFSGWLLAAHRRRLALRTAGGLALVVGVAVGWRSGETKLTVLDLNGGGAQFVDRGGWSRDLLVDCGDDKLAQYLVEPFLEAQGVNRLAQVALTHGDVRHVGGAQRIADAFRPTTILTSGMRFRSPAYRQFVEGLEFQPWQDRRLPRNDSWAGWEALHPDPTPPARVADDGALVLKAELEGVRVLLLSDLGPGGQSSLLESGLDLRAEVVVTGLPTQGEPLRDALLAAVAPQVVVVNDAAFPSNRRASDALRQRLARSGAVVICNSTAGTATIRLRAGRWQIRTMKGERWSGTRAGASARAERPGLRSPHASAPT